MSAQKRPINPVSEIYSITVASLLVKPHGIHSMLRSVPLRVHTENVHTAAQTVFTPSLHSSNILLITNNQKRPVTCDDAAPYRTEAQVMPPPTQADTSAKRRRNNSRRPATVTAFPSAPSGTPFKQFMRQITEKTL